jgi:hypothetical protein
MLAWARTCDSRDDWGKTYVDFPTAQSDQDNVLDSVVPASSKRTYFKRDGDLYSTKTIVNTTNTAVVWYLDGTAPLDNPKQITTIITRKRVLLDPLTATRVVTRAHKKLRDTGWIPLTAALQATAHNTTQVTPTP